MRWIERLIQIGFFFLLIRRPPRSTLFADTALFRSAVGEAAVGELVGEAAGIACACLGTQDPCKSRV